MSYLFECAYGFVMGIGKMGHQEGMSYIAYPHNYGVILFNELQSKEK